MGMSLTDLAILAAGLAVISVTLVILCVIGKRKFDRSTPEEKSSYSAERIPAPEDLANSNYERKDCAEKKAERKARKERKRFERRYKSVLRDISEHIVEALLKDERQGTSQSAKVSACFHIGAYWNRSITSTGDEIIIDEDKCVLYSNDFLYPKVRAQFVTQASEIIADRFTMRGYEVKISDKSTICGLDDPHSSMTSIFINGYVNQSERKK